MNCTGVANWRKWALLMWAQRISLSGKRGLYFFIYPEGWKKSFPEISQYEVEPFDSD